MEESFSLIGLDPTLAFFSTVMWFFIIYGLFYRKWSLIIVPFISFLFLFSVNEFIVKSNININFTALALCIVLSIGLIHAKLNKVFVKIGKRKSKQSAKLQ